MAQALWYAAVFIVDGLAVAQMLSNLVDREIGVAEFAAALFMLGALNSLMLLHATDPIGPCIGLIIVAFAALYRLLWRLANERQLAAIRAQDLAEYERAIRERPDLPYPYKAIGDYFFEQKMWAEAIGYYEKFLERQKDPEVLWRMRKAQEEMVREEQGLRQCPRCLSDIPKDAKVCPNCGYYLHGLVLDGLFGGSWRAEIIALGILAAIAALVAIVRLLGIDARMLLAILPLVLLAALYRVLFFSRLISSR